MTDAANLETMEPIAQNSEALEPPRREVPQYRPAQVEKAPPCQIGCPNAGDIRRWIGFVAQRDKLGLSREEAYTRAWQTITDVNPFPAVLGRVCPHACQTGCNRTTLDEPLAINAMEQWLGDFGIRAELPLVRLGDGNGEAPRETVGVIGAGPSGLSFAYQLARRGYRVTVYERRSQAGGMLRYGIPDYRLPPGILDAEIARIAALGMELVLDFRIGVDIALEELRARHDVLYVGIGAQAGKGLGLPGDDGPGVWTGTDYLARVNVGERIELGRRVVVVGGGNTAVDAARTARRTGAEVTILYRRSRDEMPAIAQEVDDALEEGVTLMLQAAPVSLARRDGVLRELVATRIQLGPPDASGRRRPVPVPGSEYPIEVDTVIAAVSQEQDFEGLEGLLVDGHLRVDEGFVADHVLAGGDALVQGIAAEAIVQGRLAAERLHATLHPERHDRASHSAAARPTIVPSSLLPDFYPLQPAHERTHLPVVDRLAATTREVVAGLTEEEFLAEAARCLSCGSCFGCEQCAMYCTVGSFVKLDRVEPGRYFAMNLDHCETCGKCIAVCPCGYLEIAPGTAPTQA